MSETVFTWKTRGGQQLKPSDMTNRHIFHCIGLILSRVPPSLFVLEDGHEFPDYSPLDVRYRLRASLVAFVTELYQRDDLTEEMIVILFGTASWLTVMFPDYETQTYQRSS